jgi:hypothetical protein
MDRNRKTLMPLSGESADDVLRKLSRWNHEAYWKERKYWEQRALDTFNSLWGKHAEFKDFILGSFPESYKRKYGDGVERGIAEYDLTPDLLRTFITKLPKRKHKELEALHKLLEQVLTTYDSDLHIWRKGENTVQSWYLGREFTLEPALFVLNGQRTMRKQGSREPTDRIKIVDRTSKSDVKRGKYSQIMQILAETSPDIAAVIEYSHEVYGKKLLLVIPELLSWSTVKLRMDKELSRIHQDFFKTRRRGRPQSHKVIEEVLAGVLENYRGKNFPLTRLSEIASKELEHWHIKIKPSAIRRHYGEILQKVRCAKKTE